VKAVLLAFVACHSVPDPIAVANAYTPQLELLSLRISALRSRLRGNPPGWQDMFRIAQLANDELGLPPFEQTTPPGKGWRPSPATLLGIKPQLAQLPPTDPLVADARHRYREGIAHVDAQLTQLEAWLASLR
jgi:hypothetical protein